MKKIIIALTILIGFVGCKAVNKLTQFEMDFTETVTIPATTFIDLPFDLDDQEISSNSSSTFESNDTRKDLIQEIILTKMELVHKSPDDYDLRFLKSISVYLNAEDLPEIKVAWKDDIDNSVGKTLLLDTSEEDLKEYVKKDKMTLKITTTTDESFPDDQTIDINTTFFVDAEILGI